MSGPYGFYLVYTIQFNFKASNNEAKYEVLIIELILAGAFKV